jgi:uncharacterized protein
MAGELVLDTSALVSLLDRSQKHHEKCVRFFEGWEASVVSTEAVLTEATHLMGRVNGGRKACLDFFLAGGAVLVPHAGNSLRRARQLLEAYADLPMDYADATLVTLAEDIETDLIFTTDRRDFGIYRLKGKKRFRIVP